VDQLRISGIKAITHRPLEHELAKGPGVNARVPAVEIVDENVAAFSNAMAAFSALSAGTNNNPTLLQLSSDARTLHAKLAADQTAGKSEAAPKSGDDAARDYEQKLADRERETTMAAQVEKEKHAKEMRDMEAKATEQARKLEALDMKAKLDAQAREIAQSEMNAQAAAATRPVHTFPAAQQIAASPLVVGGNNMVMPSNVVMPNNSVMTPSNVMMPMVVSSSPTAAAAGQAPTLFMPVN
jgi:hypothetical protein